MLILVLWVMIVLGIVGLTYTASVQTQLSTARYARGRHAAQWAARSGVERAKVELAQTDLAALTDMEPLLGGDPEYFLNQPVDDWSAYSLIGTPDAEGLPRFGLIDESSKININRASVPLLVGMGGITTEMAESLIDWRDSNEEPLTEGGESEYYMSLLMPYPAKNAAFESVRELMRVKGWGPLFDQAYPDPYRRFATVEGEVLPTGTETDLNAAPTPEPTPDPNGDPDAPPPEPAAEPEATESGGIATGEEILPEEARALLERFTAWSAAPTTNPEGSQKVNLRRTNANALTGEVPGLRQDEADAIITVAGSSGIVTAAGLLRATRQGQGGGGSNQRVFTLSRVGEIIDYLPTRVTNRPTDSGRININTASREVLLAIPGMTEELADEVIAEREGNGAIPYPGFVASLSNINDAQFAQIYPWICTQTSRFRVVSHGVDLDSGAAATIEAVLDVDALQQVTVVYWREF